MIVKNNDAEHPAVSNIAILEQLYYSSDLTLGDFFLFFKLKGIIKGNRFEDVVAIKT